MAFSLSQANWCCRRMRRQRLTTTLYLGVGIGQPRSTQKYSDAGGIRAILLPCKPNIEFGRSF